MKLTGIEWGLAWLIENTTAEIEERSDVARGWRWIKVSLAEDRFACYNSGGLSPFVHTDSLKDCISPPGPHRAY
jgi:hypothetical protein